MRSFSPRKGQETGFQACKRDKLGKTGRFRFSKRDNWIHLSRLEKRVGLVYTEVVTLVRLAKNEGENVIEF